MFGAVRRRRALLAEHSECADAAGQVDDFRSLRHAVITNLVMAKVPPNVDRALSRHATIALMMDWYAPSRMEDLVEAVGKLSGTKIG